MDVFVFVAGQKIDKPEFRHAAQPAFGFIIGGTSVVLRRGGLGGMAKANKKLREFEGDDDAFVNMGSFTGILTVVITGIVILLIIAALAPTFLRAVADLVTALEGGTTNNTTADSLLPVFGLLVALGGVFALVGYAFLAYRRRKS